MILLLKIPPLIAMEGWLEWSLISQSGIIVQSGEQHNLILNQGLDLCFQRVSGLTDIDTFAVVGTGSTAPAINQTALVAEVVRSNTSITQTTTRIGPYEWELVREREFDFAQANGVNLAEWGFAPTASGNLAIRELFRDGGGNPITITKNSSQKLRLKYTRRITISPQVATAFNFNLTNYGAVTGQFMAAPDANAGAGNNNTLQALEVLCGAGNGAQNTLSLSFCMASLRDAAMAVSPAWAAGAGIVAGSLSGTVTMQAYAAGTFSRTLDCNFTTAQGNGTAHGLLISVDHKSSNYNLNAVVGWRFAAPITKSNLQTLSFTGAAITLGRA